MFFAPKSKPSSHIFKNTRIYQNHPHIVVNMINLRIKCCHPTSKHVATELSNMFPHREFTSEIFGPVLHTNEVIYHSEDILSISKGGGLGVEALPFTNTSFCYLWLWGHPHLHLPRWTVTLHHASSFGNEVGLLGNDRFVLNGISNRHIL